MFLYYILFVLHNTQLSALNSYPSTDLRTYIAIGQGKINSKSRKMKVGPWVNIQVALIIALSA